MNKPTATLDLTLEQQNIRSFTSKMVIVKKTKKKQLLIRNLI